MQSEPSRACAFLRTPLKPLEGGPTKEVTFPANPLALCLQERAKVLDAVLLIPRPLHRHPPARLGSSPPAGVAGPAGRGGAGPHAVGGNRLLSKVSHTAPAWVRELFVRSPWPPHFADPCDFVWLRLCRLLICHFVSFEPSRLLPCRAHGGSADLKSTLVPTPICEWRSRSGCGGVLEV